MSSLYSPDAFQVPNGFSLPYYFACGVAGGLPNHRRGSLCSARRNRRNLRVIETALNPIYRAKNDIVELNADYTITPALTFTSQTAFNQRFPVVYGGLQSVQHVARSISGYQPT